MTAVMITIGVLAGSLAIAAVLRHATTPAAAVGHPSLGIVVHTLDPDKAATVARTHVGSVLLPWYGDLEALRVQLIDAYSAGLHVVVRAEAPITEAFAALVGKLPLVQVGNEPEDSAAYAAEFTAARAQFGDRLSLIPAGLSNNVTAAQLRAALDAGLGDEGMICLHVYGSPLVNAVHDRLDMADAAGWLGQILITEIGASHPGELVPALEAIPSTISTWIYDLDGDDGYALTPDELAAVTAFAGVLA